MIKLSIYDQLSRQVAILDEGWKEAGSHNCQLSINDYQLSDGVYYIRLTAGDSSETARLIILK